MSGSGVAIGIDVGGTKLAGALVAGDGSVLDQVRHATPRSSAAELVDLIVAVAGDFGHRHALDRVPVGVGIAGLIDRSGTVRFAPNLPLVDYPLGKELAARLGSPIVVDNDANAATWGEYRLGAGQAAQESMVMLTIGTGVGGGLVLGGRLVRGATGMAGELGHIAVLEGGPECPCGARGCLESLASGSALARFAREAMAAGRIPSGSPLAAHTPAEITGKAVTVAAFAGDAEAASILAAAGRWIGVGIASLIAAFDPEVVVLGGGAMQAGTLLLEPARQSAQARLLGGGHRELVPIVTATLADDAGVVGSGLLALEHATV
jgi:glucokinase